MLKKTIAFQAERCDIWPHTFGCTNKHINLNGDVDLLFFFFIGIGANLRMCGDCLVLKKTGC